MAYEDYVTSTLKMGGVTLYMGRFLIHVQDRVKQVPIDDEGCLEIIEERPLQIEFEDGDFWISIKE